MTLVPPETWKARLEAERAEHDAQRRDLQARNTELVEQRRAIAQRLDEALARLHAAEKVILALAPDPQRDGYFLPRIWALAQEPQVRTLLDRV